MFCAIISGETPTVIVWESERLIAFLDHRPLFHGHTLLVPKVHVMLLSDLPADLVPEFFTTAQRLERGVEDGLGADGSMILINNVVSQSVPHLHLHVIPRNEGEEQGRRAAVLARAKASVRRRAPGRGLRGADLRCAASVIGVGGT